MLPFRWERLSKAWLYLGFLKRHPDLKRHRVFPMIELSQQRNKK
jgi:hypothetical protein